MRSVFYSPRTQVNGHKMSRSGTTDDETLADLLEDDATATALAAVLARAEATDGTVTYADVQETVDAKTWGQLLAADVLVAAGDGFVVDDPAGLRAALESAGQDVSPGAQTQEGDSSGWRPIDKAAAVCALVLAGGYQVSAIEAPVVGAMNAVFGPAAAVVPFPLLVLGVALGTASVSMLLRRRLVDEDRIERHKTRMQAVRTRLQAARERGDSDAVERLTAEQRDLATDQVGVLVQNLRPMVWTMLVSIPVFLWLSWLVVSPSAAIAHATPLIPAIDRIVWTARVLGPVQLWMVWYVACQLLSTVAIRRGLDRVTAADRILT